MGSNTQIAMIWVVLGTTRGMMLANAPLVWLGDRIVKRVPIKRVRGIGGALSDAGHRGVDTLELTDIYSPRRADLHQLAGA